MTTSIFIKTCAKDYPWLPYAFRSILRFCTGFQSVVVVSDANLSAPPVGSMEKHFTVHLKEPGYCWQQAVKVNADSFCDSDNVFFHDSDTLITAPLKPSDLIENGKPIWLYEPYEGMTNPDVLSRQKRISDFVGRPVEFEFMRRHPFIISRELLVELRRFCLRHHGVTIEEWMMTHQDGLSEFNMMAAFCWHYMPEAISWKHPNDIPTYVRQFWSHSGISDSNRKEMEALLA